MTTIVFAAHADDEVIGCGGTIAKLAKKEKVVVVIFSYGSGHAGILTSWPPFMTEEQLRKRRIYESNRAGVILGVHKTIFLGIHSNIDEEFNQDHREKIAELINKYKPNKIFFHSNKDVHVDHIAVNKIINDILNELKYKGEVYTYQINLFEIDKREPKIIYDVSKEFPLKIKALLCFKSQIISLLILSPLILLKGITQGRKYGFKFAEYFYGR
ncbi:MAG: PIG-L family deacetylase [Nanoarchaeota archaeon]|nr:PIG-L family deacetylase [Nanoarchaeota archaeon]